MVWSFGGVGNTIGTSGGEPWPAALGVDGGVTCGYGVGVAVPGEPAVDAGAVGTLCKSWAWATLPRASALHAMTVRMLHFIDGSMA